MMWDSVDLKAYHDCVADLLETKEVNEMRDLDHHAHISCYEHSVFVSYLSFRICRRLHIDYRAAARGGLLHDLFLYDWHTDPHEGLHGFSHPKAALRNAKELCPLSPKEEDIILKHMWPLTLRQVPKYRESFVVSGADKLCALMEMFSFYRILKIKRHLALAV